MTISLDGRRRAEGRTDITDDFPSSRSPRVEDHRAHTAGTDPAAQAIVLAEAAASPDATASVLRAHELDDDTIIAMFTENPSTTEAKPSEPSAMPSRSSPWLSSADLQRNRGASRRSLRILARALGCWYEPRTLSTAVT